MILIRANTERQILVIRATLVSAPPSECLEIRLWSELAYERLTRMFGDMQQQRKICRQADALIVGGKDFQQLLKHLEEVFRRLRLANMTIKPSKLTIAPASTTLFGCEYSNQAWRPGEHRINPLQIAP